MRTALQSSGIITSPDRTVCYGRRPIAPVMPSVTCLVLVLHHATDKALLLSDNGIAARAVWCPKAMLQVDARSPHGFLVATMSKRFAEQKGLAPRFIARDDLSCEAIIALDDAERLAARKRTHLRGVHDPLPFPGRNAFA